MSVMTDDNSRQSKGQQIARAGGVNKGDGEYTVVESLRVGSATSRVFKEDGVIKCNCLDFFKGAQQNPTFSCEHIYAVKAWGAMQKNAVRPETPAAAGGTKEGPSASVATTPTASQGAPVITDSPGPAPAISPAPTSTAPNPPATHPASAPAAGGVLGTLNSLDVPWSSKISSITALGNLVTVVVTLTVGDNSRDGVGVGSLTIKGIYDAELAALEHAAARFSR